jgi:hypothetical protein
MNTKAEDARWVLPAIMAVILGFLIAGCASKPPPAQVPVSSASPPPASYPVPVALSAEQLEKLRQIDPAACQRVQANQPLNVRDVEAMARAGFSAEIIIDQVRNSRTVYHLSANDILDLKKAGVTDQVVDFMLSTPSIIAGADPIQEPSVAPYPAQTPPPAPPDETAPPAPGPDYVWVGGDWVWNGGWVWTGGHWVIPPYPHAVWFRGGWGRRYDGYHRERGHWR